MVTVLWVLFAGIMFGPFLVNLWFQRDSLRHGQREQLRWRISELVANLFLGIGFVLTVFGKRSAWALVGAALILVSSAVRGWLIWAENKQQQTQERDASL